MGPQLLRVAPLALALGVGLTRTAVAGIDSLPLALVLGALPVVVILGLAAWLDLDALAGSEVAS